MKQRPSQEMVEVLFSQRHIHDVLHKSIEIQLDDLFLLWAIRAYIVIDDYLEHFYTTAKGEPFTSKNTRIAALKESIETNGLDVIVIALLAGVIRAKRDQTIQQVIGYLQKYMPHEDHFDRARTAGELIAICSGENRLFTIKRPEQSEAPMVIVNYWAAIHDTFDSQLNWIDTLFHNPPMIKKPVPIKSRHNCGYHTFNEPVILGKFTQHEDNLDFATLNTLNKIPWLLDPTIMAIPEEPPAPCQDPQETLNFIKHKEQAQKIYNVLGDRPFWLAWQVDSRGRLYSQWIQ